MTDILDRLEALIAARLKQGATDSSYVAKQAAKGRLKLAEKLGEEAVETVIAAVAQDDEALVGEAADLIFHLLILLGERGISLDRVRAELERREGQSGIDEKAGRAK
jgi:phosphoribosyl-ATP pyrophosphohydrolase